MGHGVSEFRVRPCDEEASLNCGQLRISVSKHQHLCYSHWVDSSIIIGEECLWGDLRVLRKKEMRAALLPTKPRCCQMWVAFLCGNAKDVEKRGWQRPNMSIGVKGGPHKAWGFEKKLRKKCIYVVVVVRLLLLLGGLAMQLDTCFIVSRPTYSFEYEGFLQ